ncbi:MAG: molecular chaperone DnaJ [Blastocatellia bacterium]|jgi:molecular chaperone DnaJ|nr:molecular chaperone DnaJ [Blastocatellia bacterium]
MVDYYQVLGVKHTASSKEIKAAYKRLARLQHPDLNGGSAEAGHVFIQLSRARDILIDPKRRAEYDAQRHAAAPGPGSYAAVLKPTVENYLRRARSDVRIRQDLEKFLIAERKESRALRQAVFPIVAFLFAAFCVALIRPRIWHYSGRSGRALILTLVSLGVFHTVWKIWTAIKFLPEDQSGAKRVNLPLVGKALSGRRAFFLIGLAAIGCGLVGTLVGMSLRDLLSMAMPRFFDQSIRLELLLYPWVMVLFLNACHSLSQRLDI